MLSRSVPCRLRGPCVKSSSCSDLLGAPRTPCCGVCCGSWPRLIHSVWELGFEHWSLGHHGCPRRSPSRTWCRPQPALSHFPSRCPSSKTVWGRHS
uniref:Uncharacterized protein n=1 Tax=Mustela putorius furo TaxID=9669 RepID=M3YMU5_MUSPF